MGISENIEQGINAINSQAAELLLPKLKITASEDLRFLMLAGEEGIGQTFSIKLTYRQCVDLFELEDLNIAVEDRLQREAESSRVGGISTYLKERDNTVFPSACLIVTDLEIEEHNTEVATISGVKSLIGTIPAHSDRLFIDGQGRVGSFPKALEARPELANKHLDIKVIVVPTDNIRESADFVRQIFSDFHLGLKKPNTSQNIYFDNEAPLSRLTKDVLALGGDLGVAISGAVALDGKIRTGQIYTLASFTDFICILLGESSKKSINKSLKDEDYYNLHLALIIQYIEGLYQHLNFEAIQTITDNKNWKEATKGNVTTCVIGLKALGYAGRSLIEHALLCEDEKLNVGVLSAIAELPITDRGDKLWMEKQIYQKIEGEIKIVRSSEKRLASLFCYRMRVLPCEALV
jgi:DNA sulfur modification protein DndB